MDLRLDISQGCTDVNIITNMWECAQCYVIKQRTKTYPVLCALDFIFLFAVESAMLSRC